MTDQRLKPIALLRLAALALLPLLAGLELGDPPAGAAKTNAALDAELANCKKTTIPCTDEIIIVAGGSLQ